jgi:hypothetical protein
MADPIQRAREQVSERRRIVYLSGPDILLCIADYAGYLGLLWALPQIGYASCHSIPVL